MAFAHHVLKNADHKHGSSQLQRRARLAITLQKLSHHRGK